MKKPTCKENKGTVSSFLSIYTFDTIGWMDSFLNVKNVFISHQGNLNISRAKSSSRSSGESSFEAPSVCVLPYAACGPAGVTGAFATYSCSSGCSQREFLHPGNPSPSSSLLSLQHSCCILNCISGSCQVFFFFF